MCNNRDLGIGNTILKSGYVEVQNAILKWKVAALMRCYECGRVMRKVDDSPEIYECECGYTVRRLTKEKSKLFVRMTVP